MKWMYIILTCLSSVGSSFGWGGSGHQIVGDLAWRRLTPEAQAGVMELLEGDNRYNQTLAGACVWADVIKSLPQYEHERSTHYVNLPRRAKYYNAERDCADGYCVVEGIKRYYDILADRDNSLVKRREALKFLGHFVGDIHQPMHVGLAEDYGGNALHCTFKYWMKEENTNLHAVWDKCLIQRTAWLGWKLYARKLHGQITDEEAGAWTSDMDFAQWANESRAIFLGEKLYELPDFELGKEYTKKHMPTVNRRLQMAGVRLAELLNKALAAE